MALEIILLLFIVVAWAVVYVVFDLSGRVPPRCSGDCAQGRNCDCMK